MSMISYFPITEKTIARWLDEASIEYTIDCDDDFYVTEKNYFPFWISFSAENECIRFFTFVSFAVTGSLVEKLQLADRLNHSLVMLSFSLEGDETIQGHYDIASNYELLSYPDQRGVNFFIQTALRFSDAFVFGCREYDYKNLLKSPASHVEELPMEALAEFTLH
jgi:hypothetical protein